MGRLKFGQDWQSDLRESPMCIMEMISIGSAIISESLNGLLLALLCQANISKFAALICWSLIKAKITRKDSFWKIIE